MSDEIDALVGAMDADRFDMAGGFDFTDELASLLEARWRKQPASVVPISVLDLGWLIEGYARARQAMNSGSSA